MSSQPAKPIGRERLAIVKSNVFMVQNIGWLKSEASFPEMDAWRARIGVCVGVSPSRRSRSRKVHRRIRPTRLWELAFMSEVDAVSAISEHAKLQLGNQRNQTAADATVNRAAANQR